MMTRSEWAQAHHDWQKNYPDSYNTYQRMLTKRDDFTNYLISSSPLIMGDGDLDNIDDWRKAEEAFDKGQKTLPDWVFDAEKCQQHYNETHDA